MTVKDLKKELEQYSDDTEVIVRTYVGLPDEDYFGGPQQIDIEEISKDLENPEVVRILVG